MIESGENNTKKFFVNFCKVATYQGRVAYCLMSIHACRPSLSENFLHIDPYPILFSNMLYGVGMMISSRPSMKTICYFNRFIFSSLGSLMFNHSSMLFYEWLSMKFSNRPFLLIFLGYLSGKLMMVHLLGYLYHVDTRIDPSLPRINAYEDMYI